MCYNIMLLYGVGTGRQVIHPVVKLDLKRWAGGLFGRALSPVDGGSAAGIDPEAASASVGVWV